MPAILFVCTGNICRSPYAERYAALLAHRANRPDWTFSSAGIGALVGEPMDAEMLTELQNRGGSGDGFAARQVDTPLLQHVDWVVVMERHHRTWIVEDHPRLFRRVVTLGQVATGLSRIPAVAQGGPVGVDALVAAVMAQPGPADGEDVPDPYRRGPAVSAETATRISADLDAVLGRIFATA